MYHSPPDDLEDLVTSDTECFVDTLFQDEKTSILKCQKCSKEYKKKSYYEKHIAKCTGKRTRLARSRTQERHMDFDVSQWVTENTPLIIASISDDPLLGLLKGSPGWKTQTLAQEVSKDFQISDSLNDVFVNILSTCFGKANGKKYTHVGKFEMLECLTNMSMSSELSQAWMTQLSENPSVLCQDKRTANNLLQHVLEGLVAKFMAKVADHLTVHQEPSGQAKELSLEEQQVLYYASGYIPKKLLKRYQGRKAENKAASIFAEVVGKWIENSDDMEILSSDITCWLETQDRGGLTKVNAKFYNYILSVENELGQFWHVDSLPQYKDVDVIPVFLQKLKEKAEILETWKDLIGNDLECEDLAETLLEETIQVWVTMRVKQVVNKYIFEQKDQSTPTASRKGMPAMRKTLDKFY